MKKTFLLYLFMLISFCCKAQQDMSQFIKVYNPKINYSEVIGAAICFNQLSIEYSSSQLERIKSFSEQNVSSAAANKIVRLRELYESVKQSYTDEFPEHIKRIVGKQLDNKQLFEEAKFFVEYNSRLNIYYSSVNEIVGAISDKYNIK